MVLGNSILSERNSPGIVKALLGDLRGLRVADLTHLVSVAPTTHVGNIRTALKAIPVSILLTAEQQICHSKQM
jgi:hypothetical protein